MSRLAGQRALITGASSGTGRATARAFVHEGAAVALLARGRAGLEAAAAEIDGATVGVADISDAEQVGTGVARAIELLGGIDVVVNCAAIAAGMSLAETTPERWRETIAVNLSGTFYVARRCALHMLEHGGGTIINVASEAAMRGFGSYIAYCASKAGVVGLTRALAAELAPTITVNCICPGPIDTEMLRESLAASGDYDAAREGLLERVPLRRIATPADIAAGIIYFAAEGRCATGTTLALDGGTTSVI
jgi:NAD(P)-dependent dehydrogenase (short-subunit alcohol dehydrogenase family)